MAQLNYRISRHQIWNWMNRSFHNFFDYSITKWNYDCKPLIFHPFQTQHVWRWFQIRDLLLNYPFNWLRRPWWPNYIPRIMDRYLIALQWILKVTGIDLEIALPSVEAIQFFLVSRCNVMAIFIKLNHVLKNNVHFFTLMTRHSYWYKRLRCHLYPSKIIANL